VAGSNGKMEKFWNKMDLYLGMDASSLLDTMAAHMEYSQGKERYTAVNYDFYQSLAYAVKDRLIERWNDTMHKYYSSNVKWVYYLSMEYLIGRSLGNSIINMALGTESRKALSEIGLELEFLEQFETDAGLGNGGLGRLAACFLDSLATLEIPSFGYGLRYDYGIFNQVIDDGWQLETPENWLRYGNPWEILRQNILFPVHFFGWVNQYTDEDGDLRNEWVDTRPVMAVAYDIPVPGFGHRTVNALRLWSAKSTREFDLQYFNRGDYIGAVVDKDLTENITRVLYPSDNIIEGKELRLKQEYFFVSATLQDIIRRHRINNSSLENLADKAAIQLNDTHPALGIAELMRLLLDQEGMGWEQAWEITEKTFGYTNHTVLPEAMEKWSVDMLGKLLPRHLQIIYEINRRFLDLVKVRFPGDDDRLNRMSLIDEAGQRSVRMSHLATVGSHSVNGVSALHTEILKQNVFRDFHELWPEKYNNKTNGITPRRWLQLCNPDLADLITEHIGKGWIKNLDKLRDLEPLAADASFRKKWRAVKKHNKDNLAAIIRKRHELDVNTDSMFDCQVKRIHEYKRQMLNVLHVITLYNRIKSNPAATCIPRTVIFSGKAAPGYFMAKRIIKLINSVAEVVNSDPDIRGRLRVVFLANYGVTLAERIIPAADLSEQISTAGYEASGTGNMKLTLNGALTIGTLDGANVEILEQVKEENFFLFGLTADQVMREKSEGYIPWGIYSIDAELRRCLDMIRDGYFSDGDQEIFRPLIDSLLTPGEPYMVLRDYGAYIRCQNEVSRCFSHKEEWTAKSILNTARAGIFSSDRTIREYIRDIWQVTPLSIEKIKRKAVAPARH